MLVMDCHKYYRQRCVLNLPTSFSPAVWGVSFRHGPQVILLRSSCTSVCVTLPLVISSFLISTECHQNDKVHDPSHRQHLHFPDSQSQQAVVLSRSFPAIVCALCNSTPYISPFEHSPLWPSLPLFSTTGRTIAFISFVS